MNPIHKYHKRYLEIKAEKNISSDSERLLELIRNDVSGLNNYFMAALGMSTLILRLGAVIQICRKFEKMDEDGDIVFSKQLLDNLRETLPSDTNWKNMWEVSAEEEKWKKPVEKNQESLLSRFVAFRNKFVHQTIQLTENHIPKLVSAVSMFQEMEKLVSLFEHGTLLLKDNQYYWKDGWLETLLHPYLQMNQNPEQPYIFQGLHNKEKVHLLNTQLGDKMDQDPEQHINPLFEPIRKSLRYGAGQVFDHSSRIVGYQSVFFGREKERELLLDFCTSKDAQNVLRVKSPAGMGKGALMADLIGQLKEKSIQTLFHFCGSGLHNSLQAILYHFILQAKNSSSWDVKNAELKQKLERLPSKYKDLITLFQNLLDEHLNIVRNNKSGNLVILLDALDEAFVSTPQMSISEWFYTYDEKEEQTGDWRSKTNIRWVFSYRCAEDGSENFYKFPFMKESVKVDALQPLQGLPAAVVEEVFRKEFKVSDDFMRTLIKKAEI